MHKAACFKQLEVVKILAERMGQGAFDLQDNHGTTPLLYASMAGSIDIVKFGVEFGTQALNMADDDGRTPLSQFTFKDEDEDVNICDVEFLLDSGANVDVSDEDVFTPLMYAVYHGKVDLVKVLIGSGANVCISSRDGWKPIHIACRNTVNHQVEILQRLIEAGGDVAATNSRGETPLHIASHTGNIEIVRVILQVEEAKPTLYVLDGKN